ncbi:uncharacterized protein Dwil_GK19875 [Drosophila willistoni]|uniref:Uncharacterized protein n=2 Tax=Drosophila willistoni TaxID=7260 RepID=B4MSM3_DROWI|nr:uncharacterized protein Dwil_GK19875 [Drosophila willistoni]
MHKISMYKRALELERDLYESWLLLTVCFFLQWNQWHLITIFNCPDTDTDAEAEHCLYRLSNVAFTWSSVFFNIGLLVAILQIWPTCFKRYGHRKRLILLPIKLVILLYMTEWIELEMWQPFLGIIEHMLHSVGHAKRAETLYYYWPSLATWLMQDAYHVVRFVASFSLFLTAIDAAGPNWRSAIDFLLLGRLPETQEVQRLIRRAQQLRYQAQQMGHPMELSAQELLCDVFIQCFH